MDHPCNGISDCANNFDETNCNMILIDKRLYYKETPPLSTYDNKVDILVSVAIFAIEGFNEIDMKYRIKFSLSLKWYVSFSIVNHIHVIKIKLIPKFKPDLT
jgi:hypothetical protein